jgi:CDP-glucose 4,6-dehydratase
LQDKIHRFFCDKKVLITGHTGFVGAWLCIVLDYFGADIIGFSLKEEKNSLFERIKKDIAIKNYYGDLRNKQEIQKCIDENQPDIVFHLAAYGFIRECANNPQVAFSTNIMGTVNLLEIIRDNQSINSIVLASSDKVYKNNDMEMQLFCEEDAMGGIDPYSCSKTCQDLIVQSYYYSYLKDKNKSVTILRPSNIVGGGDHNTTRLIPSIMDCIKNNKTLQIRNPQSIRPWQYILDATDAYIIAAVKSWNSGIIDIYNVGPTQDNIKSVSQIVNILVSSSESLTKQYVFNNSVQSISEKKYLGLSIEKIKKKMGWQPHKKLEETICDTYNFYKEWDKENSYDLCQNFVKQYYQYT